MLEIEVSDQSLAISRSLVGLDQILEANAEDEGQTYEEVVLEGQISGGERKL